MTKASKIIFFLFAVYSIQLNAQDIHFSQFYNSPLNLNPASTGSFDGDYRFAGNYRNQWSSVTIPYSTYSMSGDMKNAFGINKMGAGVLFNYDNTGDSKFKTTTFNVSGSYSFFLPNDNNQQFTVGSQIGITNKKLSYDELRFDSQYTGTKFDGGLPNRESFTTNSQTFFNLHMGVSYDYIIEARKKLKIGASLFNITSPNESYFNNQAIKLDRRFSANASYQFQISDKIDLIPTMFYMKQGKYFEYIIGALGKYILSDIPGNKQAAYIGVFFRTQDAGFMSVEYDFNNWHFGLSYDINLSSLSLASNGRGGIELSAIYIFKQFRPSKSKHRTCPDYI